MMGMPRWCMWVEYAKPAVAAIIERARGTPVETRPGGEGE